MFLIGGEYYVENLNAFSLRQAIFHSLVIKKAVIEADEFENLERKSLNYGHSFGHAIEAATNYAIPHGEAVLLGIEIINKLFSDSDEISRLVGELTDLKKIKNLDSSKLIASLKTDKKISNGQISFVVVDSPGNTTFVDSKIDEDLEREVHDILAN